MAHNRIFRVVVIIASATNCKILQHTAMRYTTHQQRISKLQCCLLKIPDLFRIMLQHTAALKLQQ